MKKIINVEEGSTNCDVCPFFNLSTKECVSLSKIGFDCEVVDLSTLKVEYREPEIGRTIRQNDNERFSLYDRVIAAWGIESQIKMVMEETGEMLSAIAKAGRNRATRFDVVTELADVSIMVEQMAVFFGLDLFLDERERKLNRLQERLKKWEEKNHGSQS